MHSPGRAINEIAEECFAEWGKVGGREWFSCSRFSLCIEETAKNKNGRQLFQEKKCTLREKPGYACVYGCDDLLTYLQSAKRSCYNKRVSTARLTRIRESSKQPVLPHQ